MLTQSAYVTGLVTYVLAALFALWLMHRWLLASLPVFWRLLVILPLAALALTPAYTQPGGDTMAPALVVGAFQWITAGPEGAAHALRPLAMLSAIAAVVAVMVAVVLRLRR